MSDHLNSLHFAFTELGVRLKNPALQLDPDNRCFLKYKNKFDLEIIGLSGSSVQLNAYLIDSGEVKKDSDFRTLLSWNVSDIEFAGAYIGIHNPSKFITLNANVTLVKINSVILQNVIENFLEESLRVQKKLKLLV